MFAEFVARMEETRRPKVRTLRGGATAWGGAGKIGYDVSSRRSRRFRYQRREVNDCSPGRGGPVQNTAEQGVGHSMSKLISAEKVRAGQRYVVVCPNVVGRTKERIAQSKRARAGSVAVVD